MPTPTRQPPAHVERLCAFANTLDVSEGSDEIATRAALSAWLRGQGLLARRTPSSADDLALAHRLRSGLREVWTAHHDGRDIESPDLSSATSALPLRMTCTDVGPALEPVEDGVRGALARLLAAVNDAVIGDDWERLKICADDECRWAYYDTTKNRSKSWCGDGCSNRSKTRSYRRRRLGR